MKNIFIRKWQIILILVFGLLNLNITEYQLVKDDVIKIEVFFNARDSNGSTVAFKRKGKWFLSYRKNNFKNWKIGEKLPAKAIGEDLEKYLSLKRFRQYRKMFNRKKQLKCTETTVFYEAVAKFYKKDKSIETIKIPIVFNCDPKEEKDKEFAEYLAGLDSWGYLWEYYGSFTSE